MRNIRLLTYSILTAVFLAQPVFSEEPALLKTPEVTVEVSLADLKAEQEKKRLEKIKQYMENLIFRILQEDTDTDDLPDAGFSVNVNNQNLEKLIATKEKGKKYLFSLLKETKSGYTKERILREISKGAEGKELDDFTLETLYSIIKDKSSEIRFLTVRLLGEKASAKAIPKINSLLYDPFILRKDVYPVRAAAREAIELIKLREEANAISEEERVKKWLQVIKEKAALRQDYFCEKAVKEIALLVNQKESVWTELAAAKEMVGKKTLINNKIFGYLLLASAGLKDERTAPLIEESLKDLSLVNMAVNASSMLSIPKTIDLLLKEPANSGNALLFLEALKEKLAETETAEKANGESFRIQSPLPSGTPEERKMFFKSNYSAYDKESFDTALKNIKQILLIKRDNEAYRDAAEMCAAGLNDFNRALEYLGLYEKAVKDTSPDEACFELRARYLANTGKFSEAETLSPLMELTPYLVNRKLLDIFIGREIKEPAAECRMNYCRANMFLELKNYRNALSVLKTVEAAGCVEIPEQILKSKTALSEQKMKEETEGILTGLDTALDEGVSLEISTEKPEYNKDEEIKIKLLLKNTGTGAISGINDTAGNFGFDLLVMKDGSLIKRLKKDLSGAKGEEEQPADIFTVEPETALSSEIIAYSAAEEKNGQEVELILSYVGGPERAGVEKGWIKHPVISNELKITIRK
ncbi:MAG: hypothetical protein A2231_03960 [Candidatus Firestonebacteria bacterium RIFOXYA2_FULL_40_8]|nr:MAG: hypothetical protein A2231_03960 [Candidatus Firestonebacteria bacterium RIFOXYA2_FULL_40_8]